MDIFVELSIILVLATSLAGLMRLLKQPFIIGYVLTGLLIGPYFLEVPVSTGFLDAFSEIGIAILLFVVGLSLSPKEVKDFGKSILFVSIGQVSITFLSGFVLAKILNFELISAFYIAIALTFSSTIIVLKLLSDKRDLEKLYGRIAIGVLLFQDLIAALALVIVSTFSNGSNVVSEALFVLFKGGLLTGVVVLVCLFVLPRLSLFFAESQEFLFIFSLGWGFGLAALFRYLGLSVEIGALIAGVALSITPYSREISSRLKPLRDFFILIFFILLGFKISVGSIGEIAIPLIAFTLFVFVVKPIIIMSLTWWVGYNKKTSFLGGFTLAQISEFSLILVLLGASVGHINEKVLSVITLVGLITIAGSSYIIVYSEKVYPHLSGLLDFFESKKSYKEQDILSSYDVVLFGCNRVGYDFIEAFKSLGQSFLAVDFDPDIVTALRSSDINVRYGDAEDGEFIDDLNLKDSKMIISTIPDFEANMFLLDKTKGTARNLIVIVISYSIDEALRLYDAGADYVILPHFTGGRLIADWARKVGFDAEAFKIRKESHMPYLMQRKALGHIHPEEA